ncbi:bone sialoprotein 2 isoform X2 [Fukomys damarensis]|uniref:Integrin-binding sialoprotein n=2 Tax=Fukomys damarensis TaxID=885580 RepID=A0A091DI98_FUKDA|nr:bone sialoprotein 2 isoform X2 [Fukomys damarensis]XP_010605044.1 bone sialoprotein 2 isoform X2 [Fukomys damarensis]KFO22526.1 Bone sialoprotein 2 [Fukomys damarensis]
MKTALILLSILGMACAFSMKNLQRRFKLEDSEENGVFKYRPRYYLYKYGYLYPPLKRFAVQGNSDSSEENGGGDSSEEEEDEETSNEEENNEDSNGNEDEESETVNTTLSSVTPGYGEETTPETDYIGLAAIQLPKKAGDTGYKATKKEESDEEEEEEEEEEENENENNEAEVDENEQAVNGTSTNSTAVENGNGSSGADNGDEEGGEESVTEANMAGTTVVAGQSTGSSKTTPSPNGGFEPTTPAPNVYGSTSPPYEKTTTAEYGAEYEQSRANAYDPGYEVYDSENGEPRGDNYRAYEDEYSYYKGRGYDGYDGQDYYYRQ